VGRRARSVGGTVARESFRGRDENTVPNSVLKSEVVSIVISSTCLHFLLFIAIYDSYSVVVNVALYSKRK